ncbi:hypothetical protein VTN00DRAFT_10386 [Thermoascus crustaceus]|uniref:uncharacterized protein n=1 Tax=Thermoascus crustaceus TaxID=5088 RepID=UPI0037448329
MCRQYFTIYEWCKCQEDAGKVHCAGYRKGGCPGVDTETVHMQCFCNIHATTDWISEHKAKKKVKKNKNGKKWCQWHAKLWDKMKEGTGKGGEDAHDAPFCVVETLHMELRLER